MLKILRAERITLLLWFPKVLCYKRLGKVRLPNQNAKGCFKQKRQIEMARGRYALYLPYMVV